MKNKYWFILLGLHVVLTGLFLPDFLAQSSFVLPLDDDLLQYMAEPKDDPVAKLQREINSGKVQLEYSPAHGYLSSVLRELQIPLSSQVLVFSKTSFQQQLISPSAPRALYFNDNVYIGWVQGGEVIEVSSVDPEKGAIFYTLDQRKAASPKFVRREECLQCHASPNTSGVPGHIVRSVYPDHEGIPQLRAGSFRTDDSSPLKERWGGWYVTGTHGTQRHMGNIIVADKEHPENMDREKGANITNLGSLVDVAPYLRPHSDIVGLMVLEHQVRMHNLLTRINWETRLAISQQEAMNRALGLPLEHLSDATERRINNAVESGLRYMLFTDEAKLADAVKGTSGFEEEFSRKGPQDHNGRSLRDFDLKTRLFRYPCSFLIYSEAFDSLPKVAQERLFRRLWEVLSGQDASKDYASLTDTDRKAIFQILLDTKPNLPAYWMSDQSKFSRSHPQRISAETKNTSTAAR
ncbi:MAG: hypothetical protein U0V70_21275 [Terriglobia bacterium]